MTILAARSARPARPTGRSRRRFWTRRTRRAGLNLLGLLVALVTLFPIFWMVSTAFKPATEWYTLTPHPLPSHPTLANFRAVIDGSVIGWLKAMPELAKIPARLVIPGHGQIGVDWPLALDAERAYFTKLTADLRGLIGKGADIGQAARTAGQSEAGKWQLFGVYNPRNATAGYAELEWE